ncbi:MAG: alpha-galactosidase [Verrucomicrobia bacterium]|nr:alpha-galactosidase [Verrucomicrobiota bacterium]
MSKFPVHSGLAISLIFFLCWASLHTVHGSKPDRYQLVQDWLINPDYFRATVTIHPDGRSIVLDNGLIRRTLHRGTWSGTAEFYSHMTQEHLLRAVEPEAILTIDGVIHTIGGIKSQTNRAYLLPESFEDFQSPESAWILSSAEVVPTVERFPWKKTRHTAPVVHWPPMGSGLKTIWTSPDPAHKHIRVEVRYEIYDGIPSLMKWVVLHNDGDSPINLDHIIVEKLSVVPYEDLVEFRNIPLTPPQSIHVETDYAFQGMSYKNSAHHSVHWIPDPTFSTQVNYLMQTPCLLEVRPKRGPDQTLPPQSSWTSFRVFELAQDSTDRERRGLAHRQFYRRMAPWVTENPLILHVVSVDQNTVHRAIDQAAECGFEMVSLSFGSGLNMEDDSPENLEKFKAFSDYALQKGIHLGGYSLLSSRRIGNGQDVVSPPGESPTHGNCPALTSGWGQNYFSKLNEFFDRTGFLQFTHDGSYPGDWDVTSRPPWQKGLNDSQWVQWEIITGFYQKLRATGAYIRVPDYYYLSGANECAMGYREVNWSLPRAEQVLHTRQNIFDGTWQKTPSMGWMFVPLTQYHGGGAAATIRAPVRTFGPITKKCWLPTCCSACRPSIVVSASMILHKPGIWSREWSISTNPTAIYLRVT